MRKLVYLFIFVVAIVSCSPDDEVTIDNSDLVGTWNWSSTGGGISGDLNETPSTMGISYKLQLNSDYTYLIFENETELSSGTYSLTLQESIHSQELERFITYSEGFQRPQFLVISGMIRPTQNDALSISDNNHDGIGSLFEKME